jgi:uncharacterized membrane protein YphA (DoxX/SURF4 family)
MIDVLTAPYGVLILRLCLGVMFIAHAMLKVRVYKIPGTIAYFKSLGLPAWLAYVTIVIELGGGACLILGIMPRYVALLLIPLIVGTIVTVHGKKVGYSAIKTAAGNIRHSGRRRFLCCFCSATEHGRSCRHRCFINDGNEERQHGKYRSPRTAAEFPRWRRIG